MKNKKTKTLAWLLLGFGIPAAHAQQAIVISGGNASGSGGTAAYTVGQMAYMTNNGTNGATASGVQQPYEIWVTGVDNPAISLKLEVYPNPATSALTLAVNDARLSDLSFELSDMSGKLIEARKIVTPTVTIRVEHLPAAAYFLKVISHRKEVKTFKIIKN